MAQGGAAFDSQPVALEFHKGRFPARVEEGANLAPGRNILASEWRLRGTVLKIFYFASTTGRVAFHDLGSDAETFLVGA